MGCKSVRLYKPEQRLVWLEKRTARRQSGASPIWLSLELAGGLDDPTLVAALAKEWTVDTGARAQLAVTQADAASFGSKAAVAVTDGDPLRPVDRHQTILDAVASDLRAASVNAAVRDFRLYGVGVGHHLPRLLSIA